MANQALTRARGKSADAIARRPAARRAAPVADAAPEPKRQPATFGDTVTLVNRTSRELTVVFDGVSYPIPPGENPGFPRRMVHYAKDQNPLMGSQHPFNPHKFEPLVGVLGTKDNCGPIEQSKAVERTDRSQAKAFGKTIKHIRGEGPEAHEARMPGDDGGSGHFSSGR